MEILMIFMPSGLMHVENRTVPDMLDFLRQIRQPCLFSMRALGKYRSTDGLTTGQLISLLMYLDELGFTEVTPETEAVWAAGIHQREN